MKLQKMTRRELLKGLAVGAVAGLALGAVPQRVVRADEEHEGEEGHGFGLIIAKHEGQWGFHPDHIELHQGEEYHFHLTATEGEHQVVIPFLANPVTVKASEVTHVHVSLADVEVGEYAISMLNMDVQGTIHVGPPCSES
jgi:CO/xanthine dehydrogenase Mo-binding subunit